MSLDNNKQSPLRWLFLSICRMPPVVVLLIVILLAVLITMLITGEVSEKEAQLNQERAEIGNHDVNSTSKKKVYFSTTLIQRGCTIERKQVKAEDVNELEAWDDAVPDVTSIVGRKVKQDIPLNAQIRQGDLESAVMSQ